MKTIKLIFNVAILLAVCTGLSAQAGVKTTAQKSETFKVWGNCGMCKDRIEKAVKTEGVSSASWDEKTKMLTVSFDPSKTNLDALGKKLALVGHDTEKFKAEDKVYSTLPGCCKYERAK